MSIQRVELDQSVRQVCALKGSAYCPCFQRHVENALRHDVPFLYVLQLQLDLDTEMFDGQRQIVDGAFAQ